MNSIQEIVKQQRQFFASEITKSVDFRIEQLSKLKNAIISKESQIIEALAQDLGKPNFEGYFEMVVIQDIDYALKEIKKWVKPQKVKIGLETFPSSAKIYPEPLGVVLIIGPWNYPFSLMISPLIGAISAGNCAVLKPSEIAPHTSKILTEIITDIFPSNYIAVVEGGVETSQQLLAEKFDLIFFTGGTKIGKIVMEAAAKNLTPVTLELGGKSPCIVDSNTNLKETAKRLSWGKFVNAGQTCIAPDYLLVNQSIKSELITEIKQCIHDFYGDNPDQSPDYGRIINQRQFERLTNLLTSGKIIIGGDFDAKKRYIAPTILDEITLDDPVMEDEIFGPILPILTYNNLEEAITIINSRPKPLALYLFTNDQEKQQRILSATSSGGVCINHTILQVGVRELPFGGVGDSGIGSYHGKASFDTFSHYKSVLFKPFWGDFNLLFPPYQDKIKLFKRLFI
jgi:acyl-CoA reductase-like NAD-dependent aldehyde dehydrogenase